MIGVGTTIFLVNPATFPAAGFPNDYSVLTDGVDEYVTISNITALQGATNISLSAWVKLPAHTSGTDIIMGRFKNTGDAFWLGLNSSTGFWSGAVYNPGINRLDFNATISTNTWYHVVMVYDGTQGTATDRIKMYVNGSALTNTGSGGTIPTSLPSGTDTFEIGGTYNAGILSPLNAYIDEAAIFDYSLDATQVSSLYNSGVPTDLDNTSGVTAPVHWWRMGDGDTFPTITDVGTTGGNNGTMTNMEAGDIQTDVP